MIFFSIVITNNCGHFLEENVILRNFEKHFYLLKGCLKSLINALIMGGLDHPWVYVLFRGFKSTENVNHKMSFQPQMNLKGHIIMRKLVKLDGIRPIE